MDTWNSSHLATTDHFMQVYSNLFYYNIATIICCIYLINRFHVAVRLFSNRLQMMSKCGKNKKSGTRGDNRVCHCCSYHILTSSVIYYWTDARQHGIYLFYIIKKDFVFCLVALAWDCSSLSHFLQRNMFFSSSCFWNLSTASARLFSMSLFTQPDKIPRKCSNFLPF